MIDSVLSVIKLINNYSFMIQINNKESPIENLLL